jgi:N utilization substance protein B
MIEKVTENWLLKRMAAVDRNILRFAAYEILYRKDIPSAVTINEAIEIAKRYSSIESASFLNGVLDRLAKEAGKA